MLGLVAAILLGALALALNLTKLSALDGDAARAIERRFGVAPPPAAEDLRFVERQLFGARVDARFDLPLELDLAPFAAALCPNTPLAAGLPAADAFDAPTSWRLIADAPGAEGVACRNPRDRQAQGDARALLAAPVETALGARRRVYLHAR